MDIRDLKESEHFWFAISTAIILALIYFAGIEKFINSLTSAKPLPLLFALSSGILVFVFWASTWHRIFNLTGIKMNYKDSFETFMAGQFMNSITPLGQFGGEPVMAYLVQKNSDASYEKSISSVFSADILNTLPFLTFIFAGGLYLSVSGSLNSTVSNALMASTGLSIALGALIYTLWFRAGTIEDKFLSTFKTFEKKTGMGEKYIDIIEEKLKELEETFEIIGGDPFYLLKTSLFPHIGFSLQIVCLYLVLYSLGFSPSLVPVFFIVVLSSLASFMPTPGGSGAFEGAMAGMIEVFLPSIGFTAGLSAAIIFRICTYWSGILIGWTSFNKLQKA